MKWTRDAGSHRQMPSLSLVTYHSETEECAAGRLSDRCGKFFHLCLQWSKIIPILVRWPKLSQSGTYLIPSLVYLHRSRHNLLCTFCSWGPTASVCNLIPQLDTKSLLRARLRSSQYPNVPQSRVISSPCTSASCRAWSSCRQCAPSRRYFHSRWHKYM